MTPASADVHIGAKRKGQLEIAGFFVSATKKSPERCPGSRHPIQGAARARSPILFLSGISLFGTEVPDSQVKKHVNNFSCFPCNILDYFEFLKQLLIFYLDGTVAYQVISSYARSA